MKHLTKLFALSAIVAATAFVSCSKEIEKIEPPAQEGIKISIIADNVALAGKTELQSDNSVAWQSTDKVGFINGAEGVNVESAAAVIDSEGRATFTAEVPSEGTYWAYYPYYDNYTSTAGSKGIAVRNGSGTNNQHQHPTLTSFDPASDILISEAFEVSASGEYSTDPTALRFRRLGAFIKLTFVDNTTGSILADEYATEVGFQIVTESTNRIVGKAWVSANGLEVESGMKKVVADYDADTFALTGNSAWFGVFPYTFAEGSEIIISFTTNKRTFEKTLTMPKEVVLGAGNILPIKVKLTDTDCPPPTKTTKIEKVWEILSTSATPWTNALSIGDATCSANTDFVIAVDNNYVYVPEFGGSKRLWAISTTDKTNIKLVNTSTVESVGFDGSIFLTCARVVKKNDGTPVLIASNLFQDSSSKTGRLYMWESGIDAAPRVATLDQYNAGRRLGDSFSTYGNYEDCWLLFGTHTGNGFVTFKVPTGSTAYLISRLAIDCTDFASYYPFPGELTRGMFGWRGGSHDDGALYRNRLMTVASTEAAIKNGGAHTAELSKLTTWMSNSENNNGIGFNYTEFNDKRYVIWCMNSTDSKVFDLIVKEAALDTDWATIINTTGPFFRETLTGGRDTSWKNSADCQIFNTGDEVYIAINKIGVGIALYRMYTE